jgi:hypothetical protein
MVAGRDGSQAEYAVSRIIKEGQMTSWIRLLEGKVGVGDATR